MTLTYAPGYGGYTLTSAQQTALAGILATVEGSDLTEAGQGDAIYSYLLGLISTSGTPNTGVNQYTYEWIAGATGVNSASTSQGISIREYTNAVFEERYGFGLTTSQLNQASNSIAIALAQDILNANNPNGQGAIPGVGGIGADDAGSIASNVFNQFGDSNVFSPWAGTASFAYLGEPNFYQDWLLNMNTMTGTVFSGSSGTNVSANFKSIPGTYDLVATLEAFDSLAVTDPINTLDAWWNLPSPPTDMSVYVTETTNFFLGAYGLTESQVPNIGDGTPFDTLIEAASAPKYIAGVITGQELAVSGDTDNIVVVNAGPGDDTIEINQELSTSSALPAGVIDGGGGTNGIDYSNTSGTLTFTLEDPGSAYFSYRFEETSGNQEDDGGSEYLYEIQQVTGNSSGGVLNLPTFAQSFWTALGQNIAINLGSDTADDKVNLQGNASGDGYFISQGTSGDLIISGVSSSDGTPATYGLDVTNPGTLVTTGNTSITLEGANTDFSSNTLSFDGQSIATNVDPSSFDQYGRTYSLSGTTLTITGSTGDALTINNFQDGDFGVNINYAYTPLSIPAGATDGEGRITAINNDGVLVGEYQVQLTSGLIPIYESVEDFTNDDGAISTFNTEGWDPITYYPDGINDSGEIIGMGTNLQPDMLLPDGYFTDIGGVFTLINDSNGVYTVANAINDNGAIVGLYYDSSDTQHGFIDNGGTFTTIDDPNAGTATFQGTEVTGINNNGVMVGNYIDSSGVQHSFIDQSGVFTDLPTIAGAVAESVTGINDSNVIVGNYSDSAGVGHSFVEVGDGFITLNGAISTDVTGINDSGEIVGSGPKADGSIGYFTAAPYTPSTAQATNEDDSSSDAPDNANSGYYGDGNNITAGSGGNTSVFGDSNTLTVDTGGTVALHGSTNTVTGSGENYITTDASSEFSNITLSGADSLITSAGSADTLNLNGDSDAASMSGNGGTININGGSASVSITGNNNTANDYGAGNSTVSVGSYSNTVNLYGANSSVTDNGIYNGINLNSDSEIATLLGTSGTVNIWAGSDSVDITGSSSGDTVYDLGTGSNYITIEGGDSNNAIVYGSNSFVSVSTFIPGDSTNDYVEIDGDSDTAAYDADGGYVAIFGSNATVSMGGTNASVYDEGTAPSTTTITGDGDYGNVYVDGSTVTNSGDNGGIQLSGNGDTGTVSGSNDEATIASGGTNEAVYVYGTNNTAFDGTNGTNAITLGGTGAVAQIYGASSDAITFADSGSAILQLSAAESFAGTVAGMAGGDGIDLSDLVYDNIDTHISSITGTGAVGTATTITLTDGTITAQLALMNQYANQFAVNAADYTITADAANYGTLLQLAAAH